MVHLWVGNTVVSGGFKDAVVVLGFIRQQLKQTKQANKAGGKLLDVPLSLQLFGLLLLLMSVVFVVAASVWRAE